jgi:hypothetical protein
MLGGIVRHARAQLSIAAAQTILLAFTAGRLVGLVVDGMPSAGILGALIVELAIAALCLVTFRHRLQPAESTRHGNQPTAA